MQGCPYRQVTEISSTALNMKRIYSRNKLLIFLVHARSKAWQYFNDLRKWRSPPQLSQSTDQ
jgi:hypothetical protein